MPGTQHSFRRATWTGATGARLFSSTFPPLLVSSRSTWHAPRDHQCSEVRLVGGRRRNGSRSLASYRYGSNESIVLGANLFIPIRPSRCESRTARPRHGEGAWIVDGELNFEGTMVGRKAVALDHMNLVRMRRAEAVDLRLAVLPDRVD